jgi:DNA-binding response OmpR family regulator
MEAPLKILVVEDNPDLAANIVDYLAGRDIWSMPRATGSSACAWHATQEFDVILLDLMLPGIDGITLCRRLREEAGKVDADLMLTARDTLDDKVLGLGAGADDYLVKPFAMREVAARIQALVRVPAPPSVTRGELRVADLLRYRHLCAPAAAGARSLPPIPCACSKR